MSVQQLLDVFDTFGMTKQAHVAVAAARKALALAPDQIDYIRASLRSTLLDDHPERNRELVENLIEAVLVLASQTLH